jgi:hypothetical protein
MKGSCFFLLLFLFFFSVQCQVTKADEALAKKYFAAAQRGDAASLSAFEMSPKDYNAIKKIVKASGYFENETEFNEDFLEMLAEQKDGIKDFAETTKEEFKNNNLEAKKTKFVSVKATKEIVDGITETDFTIFFSGNNKNYSFKFSAMLLNGKWKISFAEDFSIRAA